MPTPPRRCWYLNRLMGAGILSGLATSCEVLPLGMRGILGLSCPLLITAGLWLDYRQPPNPDRPFRFSLREMFVVVTLVALFIGFVVFSMHQWQETRRHAQELGKQQVLEYEAVEMVKRRTGQSADQWASWRIKTDTGLEVHVQRIPRKEHYVLRYSDDGTFEGFSGNAP